MHRIPYHRNSAGTYVAKWPGTSVRGEGGPRKEGQPCLGRVAGKAGNVFHKAGMGH